MNPKRRLPSFQSTPQSTTSTRLNTQRGTTNATPSTSSVPINVTTSGSSPRQPAIFPSQHPTASTDRADPDPSSSLSSAYQYASPQRPGCFNRQQSSTIAIPTQTFGNTTQVAQTSSSLPFAGVGSSSFTDGNFGQSTQRRKGNVVTQSFTSSNTGYGPFAASPGSAANPGPHRYSSYPGDSSFAPAGYNSSNLNLSLHQDAFAIAGNGQQQQQQQFSSFTLSAGSSIQQTSNVMDCPPPSTFNSSTSENMTVFGFDLPSISVEDAPPSFDRVAHNMLGVMPSTFTLKEDFTEEHPILTSPATTSTRNPLSVDTAVPALLSADLTPNSHSSSQADLLSGPDDDMSEEEEGKSPAPACTNSTKRKRVRKPVERDRARPFEDRYRGGLRGAFDAVGDALKVLRNELKPNDFKGKDHTFKPSKCKVLDGSLHAVKTLETVYSELEIAKARNAQLEQEVNQLKRCLANVSIDNKSFNASTVAQGYSTHMTTQ